MKIDLTGINNIIFDLGNVLINLDFGASIKAFRELGLETDVLDPKQSYSDPIFYDFEVGKINTKEFCTGVRKVLDNPAATDLQIEDAWYAMIVDFPAQRIKLLQRLAEKYKLYIFSNTNELHISRLHRAFEAEHGMGFKSLFQKDYYSHEIKERKPDLVSFQKVIADAGVDPNETMFIDDLEKNINGAKLAGLKTFWLKNGMDLLEVFD